MKNLKQFSIFALFFVLIVGNLGVVNAAQPGMPSSFYGGIHFMTDDGGPIAGDFIEAYVPGAASYVAQDDIQTHLGDLVYAIKVPADDPDTPEKDGGLVGDTVTFTIGGRIVGSGDWVAGSNVENIIHPPKANAGGPYLTLVDESLSLSGSATDWLTGETFTYAWDLDNDGAYDDGSTAGASHTFTTTGTKNIGLKVVDSKYGEGFDAADVVVISIAGLTGQVYDGTGKSVSVTGVALPYTYTVTYNDSADLPINAGSYDVDVAVYNGAVLIGTISKTMTIDPKAASVTPADTSKTYGDQDPTSFTGSLVGFVSADDVTAEYTREAGETVGSYDITAVLSPSGVLSNYTIIYNTGTFTINQKAASVTPNAGGKVYGDTEPTLGGTLTGFLLGDGVSANYSRTTGEDAGEYTISATLSPTAVLSNYTITYNTAIFTISKRPIAVTADDMSKVFGAPDPLEFTYTYEGTLVFEDAFTGALVREAGEDPGTYAILQGELALSDNYLMSFTKGTFTITAAAHNIILAAGWNLVSFNLEPLNTDITAVLSSVDGAYDLVYAWDATGANAAFGNWMIYNPASPDNTLTTLNRAQGFWIHMIQAATLEVSGTYQATTAIGLLTDVGGWNLVGFPSSSNVDPVITFTGVLNENSLVYKYNASDPTNLWTLYDPSAPSYVNDLEQMAPGFGYWVKVDTDATWNVSY
ncbi:MAG: MBG domain-containing protein [Brevefilum sp.]|nr:MBG domain-containing protein [Brevefilum sp.]